MGQPWHPTAPVSPEQWGPPVGRHDVDQPDMTPTAKVTVGTLAGAFVTVLVSIADQLGIAIPPDVAVALAVLISFAAAYFKKSRPGDNDR